jgi:hypothetical protein
MSKLGPLGLALVLFAFGALIGCGGGSRATDDAGTGGGDDAFVAGNDAYVAPDDAFAPGDDAFVAGDDAWVAPSDDAGTTGTGACTNSSDEAVTMGSTFSDDLGNCAMMGFGAEPGLMTCIEGLGLSSGCAMCFDQQVHCTISHCALACAGGESAMCAMCRAMHCDAAFATCSGFTP